MKLQLDREGKQEIEVERFEIWVTEDKSFRLFFNKFGELEIIKQTFNEESSTIVIKPSVSNQINLI